MCEELLVEQCAPTMAGLKTGSLFSCPKEDRAELLRSIGFRYYTLFEQRKASFLPLE